MQPVYTGERGDILMFPRLGVMQQLMHNPWTHTYLCTFKRPKQE